MAAKDELGRAGEDAAARHLRACGYRILQRNWRCRFGEIDLIADRAGVLVFVEVKTRSSLDYGHPFEAITFRKLARLRRLAAEWCAARGEAAPGERVARAIRVDAIAVVGRRGEPPRIEHLEGIA